MGATWVQQWKKNGKELLKWERRSKLKVSSVSYAALLSLVTQLDSSAFQGCHCQLGPSPWSLRKISSSVLRNGHFVPLALCLGAFTYPQLEFQNNARKAGRMLKRKTAKTQYRLGIGQYQLRNVAPRRTHQRYWPVLSVIKVEKGWNKSHLWLDIAWQKVGKHSQPVYQFSEVSKRQHQDFCKMCSICCSWSVWFQLFPEPVQV